MQTASVCEIRAEKRPGCVQTGFARPAAAVEATFTHFYTQLLFSRSRREYFKKRVCARHKGRTRFLQKRGSAWSLNPNGCSVLRRHIPLERTTGDERAEHSRRSPFEPSWRNTEQTKEVGGGGEGTQGGATYKKKNGAMKRQPVFYGETTDRKDRLSSKRVK